MILLIGSSNPPETGAGGINAYVRQLCEAIIKQGHDIHICSPEPTDASWVNAYNIRHIKSNQYDNPIKLANMLIQYVKQHNIDGIINNDNPLLQSIAPAVSCPFVSVGHMGRTSVAALACFQHQWTDHVVAISSDMQSVFVRKYGVPVTKCPIVYNGVSDPGELKNLCPDKKELSVVFAGGYSKNKGSAYIEQAITQHGDLWHGTKLHWFGNVPVKVKQKLRQYDFINFRGQVGREQFIHTLSQSDIFLLASLTEGCPMAMLEAMSYGVVPIASDGLGAMRWIITSGQDGFICPLANWPKQMAQCLKYLHDHPNILSEMKSATYSTFKNNFQSEKAASHILDLLQRPTVSRSFSPEKIVILRWHRGLRKDRLKASLIDRVAIHAGWLRKAGTLNLLSYN